MSNATVDPRRAGNRSLLAQDQRQCSSVHGNAVSHIFGSGRHFTRTRSATAGTACRARPEPYVDETRASVLVLAALTSDGSSNELKGVAPVARTTEGAWAIPITLGRDSDAFPCSIYEVEPEPLRFREPRPGQSLGDRSDDSELLDALKEDDSFTVQKGYAYANKGVPLEHVPAAYDGKSAATVSGECH